MSARPVVKTSHMNAAMQEFAIMAAQDAIANFTTENEIAASIKQKFEQQYPRRGTALLVATSAAS